MLKKLGPHVALNEQKKKKEACGMALSYAKYVICSVATSVADKLHW